MWRSAAAQQTATVQQQAEPHFCELSPVLCPSLEGVFVCLGQISPPERLKSKLTGLPHRAGPQPPTESQ